MTIEEKSTQKRQDQQNLGPQKQAVLPDDLFPPQALSLLDLPLDRIEPSPFQARQQFDPDALQELASSIQQHGLLSRLRVRPHPTVEGAFQLAFGERRLRASHLAGLTTIPCEVVAYTDEQMREIGLIENVQRRDLTPLEEAHMFRQLLDSSSRRYSIRKLAQRLGKNKSYVEDRLALLHLPDDVLQVLQEQPNVSLRALYEIAKLRTPEDRAPLLQQLRTGQLSTETIRAIIRAVLDARKKRPDSADKKTLPFEPLVNKLARRKDTLLGLLHEAVEVYHADPTPRKKALLHEQLQAIQQEVQRLQDTLSS